MLIFAIDDEPNMLYLLHEAIVEAAPEARVVDLSLGTDAVTYLEAGGMHPDAVFSDIQMPGLSGLELAAWLKRYAPRTKLVFVTGYDYAMDAYRLHVRGYIPKPVEAERVREELDDIFGKSIAPEKELVRVHCFGTFEVFWHDRPLTFSRRQTKELFAFLVDRRGALCSSEVVAATLWEDRVTPKSARQRIWNLTGDLRATLRAIDMADVLVSQNKRFAVRTDLLDCDYYRMLAGDPSAQAVFRGEYMEQYSWAEATKARLLFG